jgi:hypothetical protein
LHKGVGETSGPKAERSTIRAMVRFRQGFS